MANTVEVIIVGKDQLTPALNKATGGMAGLSKMAKGALTVGLGAATAAAGALAAGLKFSIDEAIEAQNVQAQLGAVLASTGGAAGVTAEMANELATSLSGVTRFSDEAILSGENMLLTFTNIGKDVFPAATETILDMSTALGQDLQSSAIQLGKALNDPIKGVTALQRVGVTFTEGQRDMITAMVDAGDVMGAQTLILDELKKEFGGSAVAAGETFAGQLDILKNSLSNVAEEVGTALLPELTDLVQDVGPQLVDMFGDLAEEAIPAAADAMADFAEFMIQGVEAGILLLTWDNKINLALKEQERRLLAGADGYEDYSEEIERAAGVAGKYAMTQEELGEVIYWLGEQSTWAKNALIKKTEAEFEAYRIALQLEESEYRLALARAASGAAGIAATEATGESIEVTEDATEAAEEYAERLEDVNAAARDATTGIHNSTKAAQGWFDAIDTGVAGKIEGFLEDLAFFAAGGTAIDAAAEAIKIALLTHEITPEEGEKYWKQLYVEAQELEVELGNITFEEARRNISELLGISITEAGLLMDGLVDTSGIMEEALTGDFEFIAGTAINTRDRILEVESALEGLDGHLFETWLKVYIDTIGELPDGIKSGGGAGAGGSKGNAGLGFASGADFMVPPGYPNDSFGPIWAETGERVTVQTPAQQREGGGAGGRQSMSIYGLTINSNQGVGSALADLARMRPRV